MTEGIPAPLIEALGSELERQRIVSPQVGRYLTNTYGIDRDTIGSFLVERLPELEDDEIDLILSPLFTPKLADHAVVADVLGSVSVSRQLWPELIQTLRQRPTVAQLITQDDVPHKVPLREVTLERYVNRLRLDGTVSPSVYALIERSPAEDRPLLKAIARRSIWESAPRTGIIERFLKNALHAGAYRLDDVIELLNRAESYRPNDLDDLLARIPRWQAVLKEEIQAGGTHPFFSATIRDTHGWDRDQRGSDEGRVSAKEQELALLDRLQSILTAGPDAEG
jgi:hypothetical protein